MMMPSRDRGRSVSKAIVLSMGVWGLAGTPVMSLGADVAAPVCKVHKGGKCPDARRTQQAGTLGYGPPGFHPGFNGFGLGYHPGYGYGGAALGVGAEGGYPYYGGPGYPHPWPRLQRLGGIAPFPYFGGPGNGSPCMPNAFGFVGPLAPDRPVVTVDGETGADGGYGPYSGAIPYPETTFASFSSPPTDIEHYGEPNPYVSPANPASPPPAAGTGADAVPDGSDAGRPFGLDTGPSSGDDSVPGVKVTRVQPGSPADKAGLQVGDVIQSINGYRTERPSSLPWIITNAAPDDVLKLTVRGASDGQQRTVTAHRLR